VDLEHLSGRAAVLVHIHLRIVEQRRGVQNPQHRRRLRRFAVDAHRVGRHLDGIGPRRRFDQAGEFVERVQVGARASAILVDQGRAGAQAFGFPVERGGARGGGADACDFGVQRFQIAPINHLRPDHRAHQRRYREAGQHGGRDDHGARARPPVFARQHVRERRQMGASPSQRRRVRQCVAG